MDSTTIKTNSLTQFLRFVRILKAKRVTHLTTNSYYPYSITFTTRSNKQTNKILQHLHLSPLQPSLALAA